MNNRIATVDTTRKILELYQINPKKKYGQNFLVSPKIPELIYGLKDIDNDTLVIEIGPGLGAMTELLLQKAAKVICYEIDQTLCNILSELFKDNDKLEIINEDFLKVDLNSLNTNQYKKVVVVSNLPYYITSEILKTLLLLDKKIVVIAMMQKEVAHRIIKNTDYNDVVLYANLFSNISLISEVSKNDFFPKPLVDSSILRFELKEVENKAHISKIVTSLFAQRRKTIFNNLKKLNNKDISEHYIKYILDLNNLSETSRIDDLNFERIKELINSISNTTLLKACAKINVGLNIIGKKDDLHLIKSIFVPIKLYDYIEVYITDVNFNLKCNENIGDIYDSSFYKVYDQLSNKYLFGLDISLFKNIPVGSGLGGGSSDAAALLDLISKVFKINKESTTDYALKVGTDTAFFLNEGPKILDGDFKKYSDIQIDFSNYNLHLVFGDVSVSTKDIYNQFDKLNHLPPKQDFNNLLKLTNDLEESFLLLNPEYRSVKSRLLKYPFHSLSGSGPTYYYLIEKDKDEKPNEAFEIIYK